MAKAKKNKTAKKPAPGGRVGGIKVLLVNRKVRHQYEVLKSFEAGVVLQGSEVKSIRDGNVQWADAHARYDERSGELWLWGLHIGEYGHANYFNHVPAAPRKLLLHKREILAIQGMIQTKGVTVVPRQIHLRRGFIKMDICVVRGKKLVDKRRDIQKRDQEREARREMVRRNRM
ncbi:MAG: SsrA-binding protein SmpB [Planctomycetota bacterium]